MSDGFTIPDLIEGNISLLSETIANVVLMKISYDTDIARLERERDKALGAIGGIPIIVSTALPANTRGFLDKKHRKVYVHSWFYKDNWQKLPTCAGLWVRAVPNGAFSVIRIKMIDGEPCFEATLSTRVEEGDYYGPIPEKAV